MRKPLTPAEFDPTAHPRKLNLGCGGDIRAGYVNIDVNPWHGPEVLADVRKLGFLPSQHYDEILAQDVLEHLPRNETLRILMLWNRPLRIGGRLVLRVPSVLGVADLLRLPENQAPEKQEELIQALFGTQAYSGDFHLTSFTELLLHDFLGKAGFRVASLVLLHGWLFDAVAEKTSHIEICPIPDFSMLAEVGADDEFVRSCYREILKREADPGGFQYWLDGLKGGMSRQVVVDAMLGGLEYRALKRAGTD
jgi:hypothetical protein